MDLAGHLMPVQTCKENKTRESVSVPKNKKRSSFYPQGVIRFLIDDSAERRRNVWPPMMSYKETFPLRAFHKVKRVELLLKTCHASSADVLFSANKSAAVLFNWWCQSETPQQHHWSGPVTRTRTWFLLHTVHGVLFNTLLFSYSILLLQSFLGFFLHPICFKTTRVCSMIGHLL